MYAGSSEGNGSRETRHATDYVASEECHNASRKKDDEELECRSCRDSYELFKAICASSRIPGFFFCDNLPTALPLYALPASKQNQPTHAEEKGKITLLGSDYDLLAQIEALEKYYYITNPYVEDNYRILYISSALCELLSVSDVSRRPVGYSAFFTEDHSTPTISHVSKAMQTGYEV